MKQGRADGCRADRCCDGRTKSSNDVTVNAECMQLQREGRDVLSDGLLEADLPKWKRSEEVFEISSRNESSGGLTYCEITELESGSLVRTTMCSPQSQRPTQQSNIKALNTGSLLATRPASGPGQAVVTWKSQGPYSD